MSGYRPEVGHRVRITRVLEGTVAALDDTADHGTRALIKDCPKGQRITFGWVHYGDPEETAERLPSPYLPGDTYISDSGGYVRQDDGMWTGSGSQRWGDDYMRGCIESRLSHGVVCFFRDGKPVQP